MERSGGRDSVSLHPVAAAPAAAAENTRAAGPAGTAAAAPAAAPATPAAASLATTPQRLGLRTPSI